MRSGSFWTSCVRRLLTCSVSGFTLCTALMVQNSAVSAQDPFEELRIRIEKLEQENESLKSKVGAGTGRSRLRPTSLRHRSVMILPTPTIRLAEVLKRLKKTNMSAVLSKNTCDDDHRNWIRPTLPRKAKSLPWMARSLESSID